MKNLNQILLIFFCSHLLGNAQFYNKEVAASIDLKTENNMLQITGSAYNKTSLNKSLRYVLSVIKSDSTSSNKSKNNQEGRFTLEAGDKKNLSLTSINLNSKDRTIILLLIYNDKDKVVGKDRKVLNGFEGEEDALHIEKEIGLIEEDIKPNDDDGFILKGMVVQNTKTKAGNDFYDLFYSMYLTKNINGEKIVKIEEELAIGGNTQIKVFVEDNLVMRFIINPRSQYLKQMAEHSINRVNYHFQRLRNTKEQITRY